MHVFVVLIRDHSTGQINDIKVFSSAELADKFYEQNYDLFYTHNESVMVLPLPVIEEEGQVNVSSL
jgi:hypothetical protein